MNRRSVLSSAFLLGSFLGARIPSAWAHTPYRQWDIFRKQSTQILTSHADYTGDDLGDEWVAVLKENLPLSRPYVSRAHDMTRIASLLKTNQIKMAVLSYMHARLIFTGEPPFDEYVPLPLQILIDNGRYLLVSRPDLPVEQAYVITATLMGQSEKLHLVNPGKGQFGMSVHPGAKAFYDGVKMEPPAVQQ
jgi:hypothetical protein